MARGDSMRLNAADQQRADEQVRAIRGLLRNGAEDVLAIGQRMNELKKLVGKKRFQAYRVHAFRIRPSTASHYMRAAKAFAGLEPGCLANLRPTAMFELVARKVPQSARDEAISLARLGVIITIKLAKDIIGKHVGAPVRADGKNLERYRRTLTKLVEQLGVLTPTEKAAAALETASVITLLHEAAFPAAEARTQSVETSDVLSSFAEHGAQYSNLLNYPGTADASPDSNSQNSVTEGGALQDSNLLNSLHPATPPVH